MLSTFRRLIYSKAGAIVTGVVLVLIALAFAGGDVAGLRSKGLSSFGGGGDLLRVGGESVGPDAFAAQVQAAIANYRQQQPTLTPEQFIAGGGLDATLARLTNAMALDQFGQRQGMLISKRAVDGQIASIPGLQGPNGDRKSVV